MLTEEQKKMRKTGVGGSEAPALLGLHPYLKPIDVWRSKLDPSYSVVETGPMLRGTFYEAPTADWFAYVHKASLREVGTIRHPREEIVICTPDRLATIRGEEIDLSIKVPGDYALEDWGADGSDEVPDYAHLQVQYELIPLGVLYGIKRAVIAAPVRGELRTYPIEADADIQAGLLDAAKRFWRDHILTGTPPPPDASESYGEWLSARYVNGSAPPVPASPELARVVEDLRHLKAHRKELETQEQALRNRLLATIGDASGVEGLCTYRITKGRASTNWAGVCAEAGVSPALIEKHTSRTPYRTLRILKGGNENE